MLNWIKALALANFLAMLWLAVTFQLPNTLSIGIAMILLLSVWITKGPSNE